MHTHLTPVEPVIQNPRSPPENTLDMHSACKHARGMASTIQIRNVPENVHRRLKARAALDGLSLSEFMLREARRVASHPTPAELRARLEALPEHADIAISAADVIRAERRS